MSSKVKQYKKHGLKYFGESERETIFFVKSFCIKYIDQLQIKATLWTKDISKYISARRSTKK